MTHPVQTHVRRTPGVVALLVAAAVYGSYGTFNREAERMFGTAAQAWFRQIACLAMIVPALFVCNLTPRVERSRRAGMLMLCVTWAPVGALWTYAATHTKVSTAVFLMYAGSIVTAFVAGRVARRRTSPLHVAAAVIALVGIGVVSVPVDSLHAGTLCALGAGLFSGLSSALTWTVRDLPRLTVLFYEFLGGTILIGISTLVDPEPALKHFDATALLSLLVLSVLVLFVSWLLLFGFSHVEAGSGNVILSMELVSAVVISAVALHEWPNVREWIAGGMILVAALLSARPVSEQEQLA